MKETPDRRKLLAHATRMIGLDTLPSRRLEGTFKHEGNRPIFSELKQAEEDDLLQALIRQDRFGNVTAGGPDTIAEAAMRADETTMRSNISEIILDPEEARRIVNAFATHVEQVFRLPPPSTDGRGRRR
jgi:hypothetical protein